MMVRKMKWKEPLTLTLPLALTLPLTLTLPLPLTLPQTLPWEGIKEPDDGKKDEVEETEGVNGGTEEVEGVKLKTGFEPCPCPCPCRWGEFRDGIKGVKLPKGLNGSVLLFSLPL
jgi:hypothetical protein